MSRTPWRRASGAVRGLCRAAGRAAVYLLVLFPLAWTALRAAAWHAGARVPPARRARGGGEEGR
jgi:hypothetical protein